MGFRDSRLSPWPAARSVLVERRRRVSIREAAEKAFEPVAKTEAHILEDRTKRARAYFREVFKEDVEPKVESGNILFEFEELTLLYVGNRFNNRKEFLGKGWNVVERCAACNRSHAIRHITSLVQLGRYIADAPEWECRHCNEAAAA
jgi:hypothetical protein